MTWKKLLAENRVALEPTSKKELDELRLMADVNLKDARIAAVSEHGRYEFAYRGLDFKASPEVSEVGQGSK